MSGSLLRILWGVLALLLLIFWVGGFLSASTTLLVLAVGITCALGVSLQAWWTAAVERMDGSKPTLNLANILALSTVLGLALWVALPIYVELYPVLDPEDVGQSQRSRLSAEVRSQIRVDSMFKMTSRAALPKDAVLLDSLQANPQLLKGHLVVAYNERDSAAFFQSQQEQTRKLVTRALRYGRRDPDYCEQLLQLLENKELPELELQILELLHHTYPPRPQAQREEALRRSLSAAPPR